MNSRPITTLYHRYICYIFYQYLYRVLFVRERRSVVLVSILRIRKAFFFSIPETLLTCFTLDMLFPSPCSLLLAIAMCASRSLVGVLFSHSWARRHDLDLLCFVLRSRYLRTFLFPFLSCDRCMHLCHLPL